MICVISEKMMVIETGFLEEFYGIKIINKKSLYKCKNHREDGLTQAREEKTS